MSIQSTGLGRDEGAIARRTYSIDETAKLLGIGRAQCYAAARTGKIGEIAVIKIGKRLLVPRLALDRMLGQENT